MKKVKCEDNFPEVGTKMKQEQTVTFRTVSDMTVMFENNLKKEDNALRISRKNKGRQHILDDPEKGEDNFDNFMAAQTPKLETSSNSNIKTKRLKTNLSEQWEAGIVMTS